MFIEEGNNNETKDSFRPQFIQLPRLLPRCKRYALVSGLTKVAQKSNRNWWMEGWIEGVNLVLLPRNSESIFRVSKLKSIVLFLKIIVTLVLSRPFGKPFFYNKTARIGSCKILKCIKMWNKNWLNVQLGTELWVQLGRKFISLLLTALLSAFLFRLLNWVWFWLLCCVSLKNDVTRNQNTMQISHFHYNGT